MHLYVAGYAFDVPLSHQAVHALHQLRRSDPIGFGAGLRLLGRMGLGVMFAGVLWILVAGPGFLSARDSLVSADAARAEVHASR